MDYTKPQIIEEKIMTGTLLYACCQLINDTCEHDSAASGYGLC